MDIEGKLRSAAQNLANAESVLRRAADAYPALGGAGRAFSRIAKAANRPLRIGILGELNSGKSSLANLLAGVSVLPADPVVNTKLPVLLKYAPTPSVAAIYESGEKITFPVRQSVARVIASIEESGGKSNLPAGRSVPSGSVKRLEAGFPSTILRSVEILDLPVNYRGSPGYGVDAAIWTTVATQAWRETERALWAKLPQSVRSRSVLAVTFCDLAGAKQNNLKRLQARLDTLAKPHFREICFVANGDEDLAAAAARNKVLFAQIQYLAQEFTAARLGKAMTIARRMMTEAIGKLGHESESTGLASHAVEEASRDFFEVDWVAALNRPLPRGGLEKPSILRSPRASGTPAKAAAPNTARAIYAWAAGEFSKKRPPWMTAGAAALAAGAVIVLAVQLGLLGTERPVSNQPPTAGEAVEQSAGAEVERRRKEAEAAAAEARRRAEVETAAAEARRKAEAEAAAAEARWKAEAEAAAVEARRKAEAEVAAAQARWKAEAEAAAVEARRKAEAEVAAAEARRKAEAEAAAAEARRKAEAEAAAAEARRKAAAEAAVAEARRKAEAEAAAAEARRKAEAEAAAAEARRKAEAEAAAAEARGKAEAEAAAAEARRKVEMETTAAQEARRKAEAAAAEARRRKKAEAEAAEAERRRKAEAEEAERRKRAAAEEAPRRSSGSSPIMHGIGQ